MRTNVDFLTSFAEAMENGIASISFLKFLGEVAEHICSLFLPLLFPKCVDRIHQVRQ